MIRLIIMAIIMEAVVVLFTMYIFDNIGKRINNKLKTFFVEKLQDYNYLIEEKEKQLEEIRKDILVEESKLKELQETQDSTFSDSIEEKLRKMKLFKEGKIKLVDEDDIVYNYKTPDFREDKFFSNYKKIKNNFKINGEKIIKNFVKEHKNTQEQDNKYKLLSDLKMKFTEKTKYELLTLGAKEQYSILDEVLSDEEKKAIDFTKKFKNNKKFTILLFLDELEKTIKENDPTIFIYVSQETPEYNSISENIKTYVYKNISEGLIIHHKGKMYDYSI